MSKLRKQEVPHSAKNLLVSNARAVFKVVFAGEVQRGYDFTDCNVKQWYAVGKFLDDFVGKTISEVDKARKRPPDRTMMVNDPLSGTDKKVEHYKVQGKQRMHGYYNQYGYFTVTAIDPGHDIHKRK